MRRPYKSAGLLSLAFVSLISVAFCAGALEELAAKYPGGFLYWNADKQQMEQQLPNGFVFRRKGKVGQGGFGAVFAGTAMGKEMAVKSMDTSDVNAREILNIIELQSLPSVAQFYAGLITKDKIYILQELLHKDLEDEKVLRVLKDKHMLERLELYKSLTSTLLSMHAKNLLHWDLKPKNLMVDSADVKKIFVIDFGVTGPKDKPKIAGSTYWWSPDMWALYNSYNPQGELFNLHRDWSSLSTMNDAWALIFTLADIEFPSIKPSIDDLPCWDYNRNRMCVDKVLMSMDNYYEENKGRWVNECGENASWLFYRAFMRSLRFDISERVDLQGFNLLLGKIIELCNSHNNQQNAAGKGILQSAQAASFQKHETTNETFELFQGYHYNQIEEVFKADGFQFGFDIKKESEQIIEEKTEAAYPPSNDSTVTQVNDIHQALKALITNKITEIRTNRRVEESTASQPQHMESAPLPVLEKNPDVMILNKNSRRNYFVLVNFSPETESNMSSLSLHDKSILKGLGIAPEENGPGLLRR